MNLRDGVKYATNKVSSKTQSLSDFVKNNSKSLVDRLESFEDIINFEVGDTGLTRAKTLEREFDIRRLFIKYEGDKHTGTQKDRIAFAQVYDALRRKYDTISLATCGNYGVVIALAANLAGVRCVIFIPQSYNTERINEMKSLNAMIIRHDDTYGDTVEYSSEYAHHREWYDTNPGGANTPLQISAYGQIASEIVDDLGDAPMYCAALVSNGTLLAGVQKGLYRFIKRGKRHVFRK